MRSSDRPNRDNRPNKPNRQALPEQRHHTGTADAAPPPPPRALPKQRNAPPPVAAHWPHWPYWPYPTRCLSSATPHRLSQPIGPIRPIGPIPARCLSSATHRLSQPIGPIRPIGPIPAHCLSSAQQKPQSGVPDHNPVQRSCAGVGGYTHKMRAKGTPLATCKPPRYRSVPLARTREGRCQSRHNCRCTGL